MRYWILFSFLLLTGLLVAQPREVNYDSLLAVISSTTDRDDFYSTDSLLSIKQTEANEDAEKRLIYAAYYRAKLLNYEYASAIFAFRKSFIRTIEGDFAEGMSLAKEALNTFAKVNDPRMSGCYNTMAGMIVLDENFDLALKYMERAQEIDNHFEDYEYHKESIMFNHLMLGNIYIRADSIAKGEYHTSKGYEMGKEYQELNAIIYGLLNLAKIDVIREEYLAALKKNERVLEICKANEQYNTETIAHIRIGEIYEKLNKNEAALVQFRRAEELSFQQSLSERLVEIYERTAALYEKIGQMDSAYRFQKKYADQYATQNKKERAEQMKFAEMEYEFAQKNNQIVNLQQTQAHQAQENRLLIWIIVITISGLLLFLFAAWQFYKRGKLRREVKRQRQEKELAQFKMTALKSQMNPHFTFNALNSIQDLILSDKNEKSYHYITKFSQLVRKVLEHSEKDFILIEEEISWLKIYLELEQLRFEEAIDISFYQDDVKDLQVPPLLIQPFVENALKHGLLHKEGEKKLHIRFEVKKNLLVCTINDNGVGRKKSSEINFRRNTEHKSFAVKSIKDRLEIIRKTYGNDPGITYVDLQKENVAVGTSVIVKLPIKRVF